MSLKPKLNLAQRKNEKLYYDKKILLDRRINYNEKNEIENINTYQGTN